MKKIYFSVLLGVLVFGMMQTNGILKSERPKESFVIGISPWLEPQYDNNVQGFKDALAEHGLIDGKNVRFIEQNPQGDAQEQQKIIRSFIDRKVDLIYVLTAPGAVIAKSLTKDIPIVFSLVQFPVESGLVSSLEDSGNNLTGTRHYVPASKQFFAFERVVPHVESVAFVHEKGDIDSAQQLKEFQGLLSQRGIKIVDMPSGNLDDLKEKLNKQKDEFDSLYLACDPFVSSGADKVVIEFSKENQKPNFACSLDATLNGALVGNVVNFYNVGKMSGEKAALILMGAQPRWIRTQAPEESFVVINKKSAGELGITLP